MFRTIFLVCIFCGNRNTCREICAHSPSPGVLLPLHHEDHFWPLTALTVPQAPPHPHISGLQTWRFIDWFGIVLLRFAYLSLQLCLHHKKIISCDYLLFLICSPHLSSSLSRSVFVDFHSTLLFHDLPQTLLLLLPPPTPSTSSSSFSHSLLSSFFPPVWE